MAIHTAYSVRMNSAYAPTTRRSPRLPASAPKTPRRRRLAMVGHPIARSRPVTRRPAGPTPHVSPRGITRWASRPPANGHRVAAMVSATTAGQLAGRHPHHDGVTSLRHRNSLVTATGLGGTWARHLWVKANVTPSRREGQGGGRMLIAILNQSTVVAN